MPYKIDGTLDSRIVTYKNPFPYNQGLPLYCAQDDTNFFDFTGYISPLINYCPLDTETGFCQNVTTITGSPNVPSFLPTDSALWLDADDSSTLTLVSGAVSEWRDKSGNNRHATQATAGNRPLLVANGLNGTDVVRFDGSNDFLKINSLFFVGNQFDLFFVFKPSLLNVRQSIFTNGNDEASGMFWIETGSSTSGGNGLATAYTGTFTTIVNNIFTVNNSYVCQYTRNNTNNILYNQGVSVATSTSTNYLNSNQPSLIGMRRESTGSQPLNGDISQVIIFPRVLTQAEREEMEGYLAWSTGLQGNLPVGHPYKSSFPGITVTTEEVCDIYLFSNPPNL